MARPKKKGLEYFPLDVDIFEDDKMFDVQNEYGPLGEIIYIRLLCLVYRNGYYYRFESIDKLAAMLIRSVGNRWARDKRIVKDVILYLAKINLFSAELMRRNVITSRSIQERYLSAVERRQSKIEEYNLLENSKSQEGLETALKNNIPEAETRVNVTETPINVCNNPTKESKVNKSKVKESKEERSAPPPLPPPPQNNLREELVNRYGKANVLDYEQRFQKWINGKSGRCHLDMYQVIAKWLAEDGVTKPPASSINPDEIMRELMEQYQEVHNDKN